MADLTDQPVEDTDASDQPVGNGQATDLDEIVRRAVAASMESVDKRFQGFQSLMDRKLGDVQRQFKTAGLSPEEQEQLDAQDRETEVEMLRRKVELYERQKDYPVGASILAQLTQAESLEDQLSILEQALAARAAQAPVTPNADVPVPEVDRNNPARAMKPGVRTALETGVVDSDEVADAILEAFRNG